MLTGKTIVLGVCGGIAAYKAADLASSLVKLNADVHVIMTYNAQNFINPITFETLTGNKCLIDTFDRNFEYSVEHVELAKIADIVIIAPATANIIAKIAHGIADDMLTTTLLACTCKKLIAPAMNTRMYENEIVKDNMELCRSYGMKVIEPESGHLACGDTGNGKLPKPEVLLEHIIYEIGYSKDLKGKKILVTAGPTKEAIDPVRFISNHSTGKMGYAIAKLAAYRGADVTLISGLVALEKPLFVNTIYVTSARDMYNEVTSVSDHQDIIIKAAAVADYRPSYVNSEKTKKTNGDMSIELERTDDILGFLGANRIPGQFLCGFSMETENVLENSKVKLEKKHIDMIVANNLKTAGAGFGTDTNIVTIITKDSQIELGIMSKEEVACRLLDEIASLVDDK